MCTASEKQLNRGKWIIDILIMNTLFRSLFCVILISGNHNCFAQWVCGDILIDARDGKQYTTVKIGDQCWMAQNLNIGVMLSGSYIAADNGIIEKYCYNDNEDNCSIYGGLYMWNEMMNYVTTEKTSGICPAGWHIPSDAEFKKLEISLGMTPEAANLDSWRGSDQGTQLKTGGNSGFNALLSGCWAGPGSFMLLNSYEYLYTSTESGTEAWRRCIRLSSANVGRYNTFPKLYSFSVRCIMDFQPNSIRKVNDQNELEFSYINETKSLLISGEDIFKGWIYLCICNLTGEQLSEISFYHTGNSGDTSINLPHLVSGLYVIKARKGNRISTGKIIVQ
jgi:uncharacterized protein (TIGR02145 family)